MVLQATDYSQIDQRQLMDIYSEGNLENTEYFYPEVEDKAAALQKVEAGFLKFLQDDFFAAAGNAYWIFTEGGKYISALRTSTIRPGLYYVEALETRPDCRRQGYAAKLLSAVIDALKENGSYCLCDCVRKKNTASLETHQKCGFQIVSEEGFDYLSNESNPLDYGLEFRYTQEKSCPEI